MRWHTGGVRSERYNKVSFWTSPSACNRELYGTSRVRQDRYFLEPVLGMSPARATRLYPSIKTARTFLRAFLLLMVEFYFSSFNVLMRRAPTS